MSFNPVLAYYSSKRRFEHQRSVPGQMMTTVVVFGGAGFLGRRLVHRLATEGMTVRVAVRHPDPARIELRSMGFDRVTAVRADVRDQASVAAAIAGANAVVNTVSAYVEKGGVTFEAVHVQGAETVAREAVAAAVARLVLVSGIGADADSGFSYIRARGPVPFAVAEIQARLFELLPNPPLTTGQVDLLKADNVASGALPGLRELNIQPKPVEEVVPTYIGTRAPPVFRDR
jgi:uncharacterized protein YbjT (DUF2867 family)